MARRSKRKRAGKIFLWLELVNKKYRTMTANITVTARYTFFLKCAGALELKKMPTAQLTANIINWELFSMPETEIAATRQSKYVQK